MKGHSVISEAERGQIMIAALDLAKKFGIEPSKAEEILAARVKRIKRDLAEIGVKFTFRAHTDD